MTVFRYQDNEGRGPFKPGMTERWIVERESKPVGLVHQIGLHELRRHIASFSRMFPHNEFRYGFGCRSIDRLYRWFTPEERRNIAALGYHLVAILAEHVIVANNDEVMFARTRPLHQRAVILAIE